MQQLALKLWSVLRCYGAEGLAAHVEDGIHLAQQLACRIAKDPRFEIAAPPQLGLLCFRLTAGEQATHHLLDRINTTGRALLSSTRVHGRTALRVAPGGHHTRPDDLEELWSLIDDSAGHP
ncbi:pyridoxal-dependent decarboxylase [Streptomyces sp. NPDC059991]|uniref:pyridoxal-dependent decarboxylase n=1 Tax=Streptomyces sp. NPDC059991 TaxID=3347028 RepID=UPI0036A82B38